MKANLINFKNLIGTLAIIGMLLTAQASFARQIDTVDAGKSEVQKPKYLKNNVKINLSSLALKNYSFYAERSLSRKISFSVGYRNMPSTNLGSIPLIKKLNEKINEGEELVEGMNRMQAGGNAYTGEFRFYGGKKPGARGFYLALYGRYATFNHVYDYEFTTENNNTINIPIKSQVNGYGAGLMIGKQWLVAKRVNLDVYWLGGHYGKLSGTSKGEANLSSLSADDKSYLKDELDYIMPLSNPMLNTTVTNQGVDAKIDGPFGGLRGLGFSLGIAF